MANTILHYYQPTSQSDSLPVPHGPLASVLFNLSLSSGIFPTDWKSSVVIPVPKQSASISSPSNYRPISLLPLVSKLLERHVFNWLYKYCQSHNILHNNQFGFRPSFSTESALITTTHSWFSLLDSKFSICAVFFDLCSYARLLTLFLTDHFSTRCYPTISLLT